MSSISSLQSTPTLTGLGSTQSTEAAGSAQKTTGQGATGEAGKAPPPPANIPGAAPLATVGQPGGDSKAAESALQSALSVLNDPSASLDDKLKSLLGVVRDPDVLATLMIEFANMSRQQALDNNLQARSQARADLEGQADETREAASKQLTSAIISLAVSAVSLIASVGGMASALKGAKGATDGIKGAAKGVASASDDVAAGAAGAAKSTAKAMDATTKAATKGAKAVDAADDVAESAAEAAKNASASLSQTKIQMMSQVSGMINSMGGGASGIINSQATLDQAQGQEKAAAAQDALANADLAKKFMQDLEQSVKTALEFIKAMQQIEVEAQALGTRV